MTVLLVVSKDGSCSEKSEKQERHKGIKPLKGQTCKFCKKNDSLSVCYNLKFQTAEFLQKLVSALDNVGEGASCSDQLKYNSTSLKF